MLVIQHGYNGEVSDFPPDVRKRFASSYGDVMCVFLEMRGSGASGGSGDTGGYEIQDIKDGIDYVLERFAAIVDPSQIHILGYSGGGAIAYGAACRFPDTFNSATSFFGISDYGHDAIDGWWQSNSPAWMRAFMEPQIGGTPAEVPDAYHARAWVLAITNYRGLLTMFHDAQDTTVKPVMTTKIADAMDAAGMTNYAVHISDTGDDPRWLHGYPKDDDEPSNIQAEPMFIPAIANKSHSAWTIDASGTLKVAGYLVTKRFSLWLGNGLSEVGEIAYDMTTRTFTITTETDAADWTLTLKGQTPSASVTATINSVEDTQTSDSAGNVIFTGSIA